MKKMKTTNVIDAHAAGVALLSASVISLLFSLGFHTLASPDLAGLAVGSYQLQHPKLNVSLSFDIEDWEDDNETLAVPLILELLGEHGARGTFFIVGKVAEKTPGLVKKIHSAGHEIGLHTYEHLFPIFDKNQAEVVARAYDTSTEYVWKMSYKTPSAFRTSLEANREAITQAVGDVDISIFRSPCLVANWGESPEYSRVLKQSGIRVDSSVMQDFSSRSSPLRTIFTREGVIEVPVTRGDDILESGPRNIIRKMQGAGLPVVFFLHPRKFDEHDIEKLDALLSAIESEYETAYLTIGDIANIQGNE